MRVTTNAFSNALVGELASITQRQNKLQLEAATGQRIQSIGDDPAATRSALSLQAESSSVAQYKTNVARQQEHGLAVDGALKALKQVSDRAGEIATLADDLRSPEELQTYATEITELIKEAAQVLNRPHNGDFIFAGTKNNAAPFTVSTNPAGAVTSVAYNGDSEVNAFEVSENVTVSNQIPGANNSGAGARGLAADSRAGADIFAHLIALQDRLAAGDTAGVRALRTDLAKDEENILYHISHNGAIQARLEAASSSLKDRSATIDQQISTATDADLAQTLVRLNETMNAYRAALQTGGTLLDRSLLDYLR